MLFSNIKTLNCHFNRIFSGNGWDFHCSWILCPGVEIKHFRGKSTAANTPMPPGVCTTNRLCGSEGCEVSFSIKRRSLCSTLVYKTRAQRDYSRREKVLKELSSFKVHYTSGAIYSVKYN